MKTLSLTLAVAALGLSACAGQNTNYNAGASYASSRTAGTVDVQRPTKTERMYKNSLSK